MRAIPAATQARLDDAAATFCHCWQLVRRDGVAQGFTNHDADLTFEGVLYEADAGLDAAKMDAQLGLAPGAMDVAGALNSASLSETDLANGVYDGASIEIWLVDWREPAHRILLDAATLGEVRRGNKALPPSFARSRTGWIKSAGAGFSVVAPPILAMLRAASI
jgi:uncharacterized phage protein (TIGR02218 family)